jgi:nucleotide-binding universal stress UspA family protein
MFEKLLVATDLSRASDCLLQCAGELKDVGLKKVILTHVVYVANTPGMEDALEAEASPALLRQKKALEEQGIAVETRMPFGIPAHCLNDLSEKNDVDAIVVGSRGRSIAQRALLGSVAFKLLQVAHKPVLLARVRLIGEGETCRFSVCQRLFAQILFPTDFSETARRQRGLFVDCHRNPGQGVFPRDVSRQPGP